MRIVENPDPPLVQHFLDNLKSELNSFRYFDKRPVSIIENHLCTLLLMDGSLPIAYGHLDPEAGKLWLGIAVMREYQGKKLGFKMMEELMKRAKDNDEKEIHLTVDKSNSNAIALYKKFNFKFLKRLNGQVELYCRTLD